MFTAAIKAFADLTAPELRGVLWKSIALSIGLFVAMWFTLEFVLTTLVHFTWTWLATALQLSAGLGLIASFYFLMGPVTALFAGLFQDGVARAVEARHFSPEQAGRALAFWPASMFALKFSALALGVNFIAIATLLFAGAGALILFLANAYLISREYFELVAARHMTLAEAAQLRRANAVRIFVAGLIPAALSMVPFVNIVTPVFATSYFLHLFRQGPSNLV